MGFHLNGLTTVVDLFSHINTPFQNRSRAEMPSQSSNYTTTYSGDEVGNHKMLIAKRTNKVILKHNTFYKDFQRENIYMNYFVGVNYPIFCGL